MRPTTNLSKYLFRRLQITVLLLLINEHTQFIYDVHDIVLYRDNISAASGLRHTKFYNKALVTMASKLDSNVFGDVGYLVRV